MAYILGQYNKTKNDGDDESFLNYVKIGEAKRKSTSSDSETGTGGLIFYNECFILPTTTFTLSKNYYFHCKIKRMSTTQDFTIKLIKYNPSSGEEKVEQFIKEITIAQGNIDPDYAEWVDVEFTFTPLNNFDTILFELRRISDDYTKGARYPIIGYQELSSIENLIPRKIKNNVQLIKIGVQSRPGLNMNINGEDIRVPRTGIYELKNGIINISFFSIVMAAKENTSALKDWMDEMNHKLTPETDPNKTDSKCFNDTDTYSKTRTIDSFTLDYMYKEGEEG